MSSRRTKLKAFALRSITENDSRSFIAQLTDCAIDCNNQLDDEWIVEIAAIRMFTRGPLNPTHSLFPSSTSFNSSPRAHPPLLLFNMGSAHSRCAADFKSIALRTLTDQDCHTFIAQITDYAINCNQQFNDKWIAQVSGLRMFDDALDWYTDLDQETQESWQKLRNALLKEAKLRSGGFLLSNSSSAAPPPALVPTPAAASERASSTNPVTHVGRIRVQADDDPQYNGYLSSALSQDGCLQVTNETCNALTVWYDPNKPNPRLYITNPSRLHNAALGIHWNSDPKERGGSLCTGRLVIVDPTSPTTTSSWTTVQGPCSTLVFWILTSAVLLFFPDNHQYVLGTCVERGTNLPQLCILSDDNGGVPEAFCKVEFKIEFL